MPKLPIMSGKKLHDYLIKYGCVDVSSKGSHFRIENPKNGKRAPIPIHSNEDIGRGLSHRILKELEIDIDDFLKFTS